MAEIYFVRTETLPELPPPVAERGMVKWLRENLFSSVISGILTIVALWAVYKFSAFALPWVAVVCGIQKVWPPAATFWTAPEARVFLC